MTGVMGGLLVATVVAGLTDALPTQWLFVALIATGSLCGLVVHWWIRRPRSLQEVYRDL